MKAQDLVKIVEGSKRYRGQVGQIVRANNIKSYSPSTGVEKVTSAWDVKVLGDVIRFEETSLDLVQSVSATSDKALLLAAIWGSAKWNGRTYGRKVFVNGQEIVLSWDLIPIVQQKPSPDQLGLTLIKSYQDISAKYGEYESHTCTVEEWQMGSEIIKRINHNF